MNKFELKEILEKEGIESKLYSLDGDISKPGSLVLQELSNRWEIIGISDRGAQELLRVFENEADACQYLYKRLQKFKQTMDKANQIKKRKGGNNNNDDVIKL
ncbi:hypothetical protein [Flagellimonas crocea]|uniref:hypothetical protein n=1 Tax=Flagellimonas crocea TaxID=3067311 RepID=UPI00296F2E29|nr:hypothetical protein [Muricauda sp. DH64]